MPRPSRTNHITLLSLAIALCAYFSAPLPSVASGGFWDSHIIRHVGMREGLPGNFVDHICEDGSGFIWFATGGSGIVRYDGYSFVTFDCSNTPVLRSNFIRALAVDGKGGLFIGTDRGICRFDTKTERFDSLSVRDKNGESLSDGPVTHIAVDDNDNVWFSLRHSVVCVSMDAEGKPRIVDRYEFGHSVTAVERGSRGVYVASLADVYLCSADAEQSRIVVKPDRHPSLAESNSVVEAIYESSGYLWMGSNNGLFRFNMTTGEERVYTHSERDPSSLSQNRVTDITTNDDGRVIVATLKGLNIYNHETDNFERVTQDDAVDGKSLCSNFVNCLLSTSQGVWVGTDIAGSDLLSPVSLDVTNYSTDDICSFNAARARQARVLSPVNSIAEDADGTLWVGVVEGGLSRRVRGAKKFENLNSANHGLSDNNFSSLTIDASHQLWAGTWGGGIDVIDLSKPNLPVVKRFYAWERMAGGLSSDYIGAMEYDSINDGVWVGTIRGIDFIKDGKVTEPMGHGTFTDMNGSLGSCIDGHGRLWMGSSLGLFIIDLNSFKQEEGTVEFSKIYHKLDDPNLDGDPRVTFLHYSRATRRVFVGTNGFGLYACDEDAPELRFANVSASDGLANNSVASISEDGDGNIWVGTANGLSLMAPDLTLINSYTTADGLLSDCYYWNAAWSSPLTGHVFIGSVDGMSEIGTSLKSVSMQIRRAPVLTKLLVNNAEVMPDVDGVISASIEDCEEITIHESCKSVGLEFSSLNFLAPSAVRYQYRLDGFDTDWINVPKGQHVALYTNLSAGEYKLRIRYAATNGKWSNEREMRLIVTPFFYKTVWFVLISIALAVALISFIFKYRMRYIEESRKMLHMQVRQRTHELEVQKQALEDKKAELEQSNAKLQDQNNYISRQKENILEMTSKIQRLSIDKLQFFTNISHELRSPLTLITGPVKRAQSLCKQPEVQIQLDLIERSSHTLLSTVNQLMDFRKVETSGIELHPVSTNIEDYITSMIAPYVAYAAEQGIKLRSFFHLGSPFVRIDTDALTKIISNLISNAIKYSAGGKVVDLFVCQMTIDGRLSTYICVRDRGVGIPPDQVNKVFDRYYQSTSNPSDRNVSSNSTGIGLYVVNRIVMQCDGEVWARNNPGGGSSMRILLPTPAGCSVGNGTPDSKTRYDEIEGQIGGQLSDNERMTILVVEDSQDMRLYIRTILESEYHVIEAANGIDGLTALAENDVDFIIADLMMPIMDGLEFARKVKGDFTFSHTPILILTAQMNKAYQTESYSIGVESYLYKPFDEGMLKARISGILASRQKNQKRFLNTLDTSDLNIVRESEDEKFVERVTSYVKQNYKNPDLSIDDIVSGVGCSKSMLHKKMQSVIGQAPGNFIRTYRLNVAREILANKQNRLNVSQVAYEVGFNDPKYFSRCFTKAFGYPPSMIN